MLTDSWYMKWWMTIRHEVISSPRAARITRSRSSSGPSLHAWSQTLEQPWLRLMVRRMVTLGFSGGLRFKILLSSSCLLVSTDDKPVILVLVHHLLEPTSSVRSCKDHPNVVLQVHVFFHETKSGLLKCKENTVAISDTRNKLLEYCTQMIPENLKCESERRKKPEFGDKKQDLYESKQNSQKGLKKKSSFIPWPFGPSL